MGGMNTQCFSQKPKMMMPFRFSQLVLIWFFVASCSSDLQVSADYDKTVDFDSYKSFFFLPWDAENSKLINEIDQYLLTNAVKGQMIDRGYAYGENAGDMAISLFIVLEDKSSTTAYTNHYGGYGYGGYYYGPGWGWGGRICDHNLLYVSLLKGHAGYRCFRYHNQKTHVAECCFQDR